jgi:hypothetical protein
LARRSSLQPVGSSAPARKTAGARSVDPESLWGCLRLASPIGKPLGSIFPANSCPGDAAQPGLWLAPLNGGCRPHPVSLNHLAGWDVDYPAPSMPHAHPRPGGRLSAIHRLRGRSLGVGIQAHDALPTPRHGSRGLPATRDHCDRRRRNLLRTKIGRRIDRERSRVRQFPPQSRHLAWRAKPTAYSRPTRRARLLPRPPGARWLKAFSLAEPEATRKSNPPSLRFSTDAQFFAV